MLFKIVPEWHYSAYGHQVTRSNELMPQIGIMQLIMYRDS